MIERSKEYILAAQSLRFSAPRIIFGHLLPNSLSALSVVVVVQIAGAIALEATLSFLGIGLPITQPSLGLLIANGYSSMLSGEYWLSFYPGLRPAAPAGRHQPDRRAAARTERSAGDRMSSEVAR